MNSVFYLFRKQTKNTIYKILKNPAALIGYILFFCFYLFIGLRIGNKNISDSIFSNGDFFYIMLNLSGVFISFMYLYPNSKKGINGFLTADITLMFQAPLKTFDILVSLILRQVLAGFFTLLVILAQMPILKAMFHLSYEGVLLYFLSTLVMCIYSPIIMILRVFFLRNRPILTQVYKIIYLISIAVIFLIPIIPAISANDHFKGYITSLKSAWIDMIPITGWMRAISVSPVTGFTPTLVISFFLFTVLIIISMVYISKQNDTEWFEESAQTAEQNGVAMEAMKKGAFPSVKLPLRYKNIRFTFTGRGSAAIFQKHLLEYRKTGFLFVNLKSLLFIILGGLLGWLASKDIDKETPVMVMCLLMISLISIIFSMVNRWNREVRSPYLYLIPDTPLRKLLMVTASSAIKHSIDGFVFFMLISIMNKISVFETIIATLGYVLLNQSFVSLDILGNRLFGKLNASNFKLLINYIAQIIIIIPAIAVSIILSEMKLPSILSVLSFTAVAGVFFVTLSFYAASALRYPEYFE